VLLPFTGGTGRGPDGGVGYPTSHTWNCSWRVIPTS